MSIRRTDRGPGPSHNPRGIQKPLRTGGAPVDQLLAATPSGPFEPPPRDQMVLEDDSLGKQESFASVIRGFPGEACPEDGFPGIKWVHVADFQVPPSFRGKQQAAASEYSSAPKDTQSKVSLVVAGGKQWALREWNRPPGPGL